ARPDESRAADRRARRRHRSTKPSPAIGSMNGGRRRRLLIHTLELCPTTTTKSENLAHGFQINPGEGSNPLKRGSHGRCALRTGKDRSRNPKTRKQLKEA